MVNAINKTMIKTALLTTLALVAFAGNSILCRLALGENTIDAASFTSVRLLSGMIVLALILKTLQARDSVASKGSWKSSFLLFIYAITFSYAYISLDTGIGALILFASVQITMIFFGWLSGGRFHFTEWLGVILSFLGFMYLVFPQLSSPSLVGFLLMTISGIAWGLYTLAGKTSKNPLSDTTYNFIRSFPLVIILIAFSIQNTTLSLEGIFLAIISGGVTSGIGYAIWYVALGSLSSMQAAVVQLLVPVIAALGGILFANEVISARLLVSSVIILGGILMVVLGKHYLAKRDYESSKL